MRLMKVVFKYFSNHTKSQLDKLKVKEVKICEDYVSMGAPKDSNLNIK